MIFLQNVCLFFAGVNRKKFIPKPVDNVNNSVYNSIFRRFRVPFCG